MQHAGKSPIKLSSALRPGQPFTAYGSHNTTLNTLLKPDGRVLTTEYGADGKVTAQHAPVGPNSEIHPIGRYEYQDRATIVLDAEGHKTIYRYDDHKKITAIEIYQDNALYRTDRFSWDQATGNLLCKTVEDSTAKPLQITQYAYDKNQNPILERVGDGSEWRTLTRTFSDDGFNLRLTETDREGRLTCYTYIPGTNLLGSELTYEGNTIRVRTFHTYDDCAICTQTITDDGSTTDPDNLQGVSYRKITTINPKYTLPCFGLPEVIEEKTIDASGNEMLLHKVIYTYTPSGQVLEEEHYDADGAYRYSIYNTYDAQENLATTTDPLGATTTYTYDANHNPTSITGPRTDQYREIAYDKANRPTYISNWQADGTVLFTEKRYNKLGHIIEEIDACKNSTRFEYDALGRVKAIQHPDGAVERKEYDILCNVIKEIDPQGYVTTKSFNTFCQLLSIQYPDGSAEHFNYNSTGQIHTHLDKNGTTTCYTYDIFEHPIRTETYSCSGHLLKSTTSSWSPFQKLSETKDDLTTLYTYDCAGRKTGEQKAYHKTEYTHDPLGRLVCSQNEETQHVTEYDLCGRPIRIRTEKGLSLQKQEECTYDLAGNPTHTITSQGFTETHFNTDGKPLSIQDPLGHTTLFSYSYQDVLTKTTTNPKGIQSVIIYDIRGREAIRLKKNVIGETIQRSESCYDNNSNLIQLTHTLFADTTPIKTITHYWEYGPQGRLERFVEAGEKETRYLYDPRARLHIIIKPNGCQIIHAYDELGRLARYHAHDFDYHYTYDPSDRVIAVHDSISNTTTKRTYDPLSNICQETLASGLTFSHTYDTRGRRIKTTLPNNSIIDYTYDGIYLHTVSRNNYKHTYSARNLEGQIIQALTPAGEILITRDALGRYTSLVAPHFTAHYTQYDPVGNLIHYTYQDTLGKANRHHTHDDLDQLTQEDEHIYHYDSLHNRLKKDTHEYAINSLCQVTHDGETAYTYDPCGNLISDGTRTYSYDNLDRLIVVEEGDKKTEYTYDPFHRRLSKTTYLRGYKQKTIRYLWDGNNEIGTVDEYDRLRELRVLGEGLGAEIGAAVLYELDSKPYIPIHDHRGCVVTLISPGTQKPIESYRYTAFGQEQTDSTLSPWRFSSKRIDEETSLVFFGRRYYNPQLGRWITQDPQGFGDGPNLYAYVHNCPLTQFDCYGLVGVGKYFSTLSRMAFKGIEWTGANLLPIPYARNFVESVGRWGSGGEFRGPSRYRSAANEVITIPGRTTPGHSYTHGNGMLTHKTDAVKQAEYISQTHGGVQVDLMYHGTNGLVMDLINSGLSKIGMPTSYNKMCANYYQEKLRGDPNHLFTSSVHSRGGTQIMNTGRLVGPEIRQQHIDVLSYGSATLIPKGYFRSAQNNVSMLDVVTMTNPLAFGVGLLSNQYNMNFLKTSTGCPLKAHGFLEATYAEEIKKKGFDFVEKYFNE